MNDATESLDLALSNVSAAYTEELEQFLQDTWATTKNLVAVADALERRIDEEVENHPLYEQITQADLIIAFVGIGRNQIDYEALTMRWMRYMQVEAHNQGKHDPFPGFSL